MANRIGTFPTFANLAPPWSLPTLDSNFVSVNTAVNDSSLGFVNGILTDTGSVNAYVVTCPFGAPTAYNPGMAVAFTPANSNTGGSTITVSPLGSVSILTSTGGALPAGALQAGQTAFMVLVGTAFRLLSASYNPSLNQFSSIAPGTQTINVAGFNAIEIFATLTTVGAYTFTLNNLPQGVPVYVTILTNGSGRQVSMTATNPASLAYVIRSVYQNASSNLVSGFDVAPNALVYQGVTFSNAGSPILYLGGSFY